MLDFTQKSASVVIMDAEYYEDMWVEHLAKRDVYYEIHSKHTDDDLIQICADVQDEAPHIVRGIIDYHKKSAKITEKQRGVLIGFLAELDTNYYI